MAPCQIILLSLLILCHPAVGIEQKNFARISLGSKLSPIMKQTSWSSPSRRFEFGFYNERDGFKVGIWLTGKSQTIEKTITWTANRDDDPVSPNSTIELTPDGKLVLKTGLGSHELIADISGVASYASMSDSGNFCLHDNESRIIWDSFNFPTDTLLGGQVLPPGSELVSSVSQEVHSTGQFRLSMQSDGNLVMYPVHTLAVGVDAYWSSDTAGDNGIHLYLNFTGKLALINSSNSRTVKTIEGGDSVVTSYDRDSSNYEYGASSTAGLLSYDSSVIYRGTLQHDGLFKLFSHVFYEKGDYGTSLEWKVPDDQCEVKRFCSFNSYCTKNDDTPVCRCIPGTDFVDGVEESSPARLGCQRNFTEEFCAGPISNASSINIFTMEDMTWDDPPYSTAKMGKEDCINSCLEDCNCEVALFNDEGYCKKQKLPLIYAKRDQKNPSTAIFKVGMKGLRSKNMTDIASPLPDLQPPPKVIESKGSTVLLLVVTLGLVTSSCTALIVAGIFFFKLRIFEYEELLDCGGNEMGLGGELTLRSFSYKELKRATNGFKEELGKGSFGSVYKGTLHRGRRKTIAVKRLEKVVTEGEREFRAEMRVIGRTHHKNLVRLLGYCAEQSKRLLVYEYMSNGSLADILFRSERRPEWTERVRIALDIARGILYLHEGCDTPIIHCDIKPQNILMDEFWTAKISDFGLAKLLMPDQTRTFTIVRGTRGYLAPEWNQNIPISVKADVYSFGVMLLEIVCCRKNMEVNISRPDEIVLASWVYKNFRAREVEKVVKGEEVDKKSLEKLVTVGLWCIQDEPALRPSMKSVVMMLEGVTEVSIPPCPSAANTFN
ncbi:hypothetical protein CDL15_Pgr017300 [Punica granatum]|uniref:Receptor-like serine/threonine-protein kinase n=1 Tax=Punica granatum TaxID=22663 RepID=A0A218Y4C6_PUNGR|nr:hypothetical protein CDL15_Pgr017300 [Punica granatum]